MQSQRKLIVTFIGVSIFAFLLVFISVEGFLNRAFLELYFGQFLPPELIAILPAFTLAQLHDIGIVLASIGLVLLYLPLTLTLVITEKTETSTNRVRNWLVNFVAHSDLLTILGFLGLFLASTGVWFCMHQAFLYQGEYLKGTLPSNIYVFLTIEIPPLLLNAFGNLIVIYGLIIIVLINALKIIFGIISQRGGRP
jgi:hypothetical protein